MSEGEAVGLIRQVFICRQYFHSEKSLSSPLPALVDDNCSGKV